MGWGGGFQLVFFLDGKGGLEEKGRLLEAGEGGFYALSIASSSSVSEGEESSSSRAEVGTLSATSVMLMASLLGQAGGECVVNWFT